MTTPIRGGGSSGNDEDFWEIVKEAVGNWWLGVACMLVIVFSAWAVYHFFTSR